MRGCVCGSESGRQAQFCWNCGRRIGAVDQEPVLLLDSGHEESSTSVVRGGGWNGRSWLALAALLAVVSVGALWGSRQSEVSAPIEQGDEDQATAGSTSTTMPSTTTSNETVATTESQVADPPETQLLNTGFEGTFGYDLLITTTGRPARLDLDTGTVTYAKGSRVSPQFVFGSWVVVESGVDGSVARLPLSDLGAGLQPFVETESIAEYSHIASSALRAVESGELWIAVQRDLNSEHPTETLYLADIDTGEILDEREADAEAWRLVSSGREGLFTGPSGGVYQTTGDTYQRVTDGRVVASDDRRALIQTCDDALVCTLEWLDRRNWEPLGLAVPDDEDAFHVVIPGTDWLSSTLYGPSGQTTAELLNVVTGRRIAIDSPRSGYGNAMLLPPVSPDGTWLATRTGETRQLELRNLETGQTTLIELDKAIGGPVFFVEDAATTLADDAAGRLIACMRGNGGVEATAVRFVLDGQTIRDVERTYTGKGSPLYDDVYQSCLRRIAEELDLEID